jgi:regulator of cell morphogenesis and NO signaling
MDDRFDTMTVGELVALDYRTAAVLERFDIDVCCGGRRLLMDACAAAGASPERVKRALEELPQRSTPDDDEASWSLDRLVTRIVSTYHAHARADLPVAVRETRKLAAAHGERHSELRVIASLVEQLSQDLLQHMAKEEGVLFPYLRELDADAPVGRSPFGTVDNPIHMMEREHAEAGQLLQTLRALTNGYTVPPDGCTTYHAARRLLDNFDHELRRHIHLENNVLFPKAQERERAQWQS